MGAADHFEGLDDRNVEDEIEPETVNQAAAVRRAWSELKQEVWLLLWSWLEGGK